MLRDHCWRLIRHKSIYYKYLDYIYLDALEAVNPEAVTIIR